ncbi:MAG: hypothetical protein V4719_15945 [Planctomycetota bacterium]
MSGVNKGTSFKDKYSQVPAQSFGKIVREYAATNTGADDNNVEVISRCEILSNQSFARG